MKKNNPTDFSIPRRQSYSAILFFIYRFFKIVVRQIWPILLALLFGREQLKMTLLYIVIGVSILILIFSIIAFFKYFFYIKDNELVVEKGVFQKSRTNVPFERIQTINFEQSVLHQAFNVVKLEIDTAGSKGNEFSFAALDKEVAGELREKILSQRSEIISAKSVALDGSNPEQFAEVKETQIMKLSFGELIKIGLGQNHLRSFLLIVIFFSWIFEQLNDIGFSPDDLEEMMTEEINPEAIFYGKVAIITFAILAILVTLAISLIRTILRYYDFRLLRTSDGFKVDSGLFNRRQISARDNKVQIVSWSDNPLKRLIGIFDVFLKQASSIQVQNKKSIVIPGCDRNNLEKIKNYYFDPSEWEDLNKFRISKLFIVRRMLYGGLVPFVIAFSFLLYFYSLSYAMIALLWLPIIYLMSLVTYRKWRFYLNQHILYVHHGLFGNYNKSLRLYKIQSVTLDQSIYHRMNDLANVVIYTASGRVTIPFVSIELAHKMVDFISYKIEVDKRSWM